MYRLKSLSTKVGFISVRSLEKNCRNYRLRTFHNKSDFGAVRKKTLLKCNYLGNIIPFKCLSEGTNITAKKTDVSEDMKKDVESDVVGTNALKSDDVETDGLESDFMESDRFDNELTREEMDAMHAERTQRIFEEIADGNEEVLQKLKLLELEVNLYKENNRFYDLYLEKKNWVYLLGLTSINSKHKYLLKSFTKQLRQINRKKKKMYKRQALLDSQNDGSYISSKYSCGGQSMFVRVYRKSLLSSLKFRSLAAENYGQHFVFDCSYQEHMSKYNTANCALQLQYCLNVHYCHKYPAFIRFCNYDESDELHEVFRNVISTNIEDLPWSFHKESYLDFYPKKKLVYLTPHCSQTLKTLTPDTVYIIGAFVDKGIGIKASLAKAKENDLKMAKLPIDEYVRWKQGSKALPLNVLLKILLDMKYYNNWDIAFQNLPPRCLRRY